MDIDIDLNELLQQAQKMANEHGTSEMPTMERTFSQVLEATQELHNRVTTTGSKDLQAHILLGSKGIDLPKITQKLEEVTKRSTFAPVDPIADTDIKSFIKNERENAILSIIEEVKQKTVKSGHKAKWNRIMSDWEQEKVKILNAFVAPSEDWIDLRSMPEQTVLDENVNSRSHLNRAELTFAREVLEYNNNVMKGISRPNLVEIFAKTAKSFNDPKVDEIWDLMKTMVDVMPMSVHRDPIENRKTAKPFIIQAKKYLESRYKLYMSTIVNTNLLAAQRGGVPSLITLVTAFVSLTFNADKCLGLQDSNFENRMPLWPIVYFCLRCGDLSAALECMKRGGATHEDLILVLEEKKKKPEQKINAKLEGLLKLYYCNKIKNSTDPYKKAVYCILAGCDNSEPHLELTKTTDDFVWMQLSILRMDGNDGDYKYSDLQTIIIEKYGEKYFTAKDNRHLYFQVLALTGQFEAAIEFLSRTEQYRVYAVHIALALNELCLIGGPRNVEAPLLSVDTKDPVPMRRLNLARLVRLYVKDFEIINPKEALQYYFFLRHLKDSDGRNLFLVCVCQLAVELRDYDLLFGKISPSGNIVGGLFEQFDSVEYDVRTVAGMVAEEMVRKGTFEDAIKLYDIADNQNQSLRYIAILLSQVVSQRSLPGSLRERLILMSIELMERCHANRIDSDPQVFAAFRLLNELAAFFDHYNNENYQVALDILTKTKLVPFTLNEVNECLQNFKRLNGDVTRVYPDVLLAAMDIIYLQYKSIKARNPLDPSREQQLKQIREKAKTITNMAASVPYRMPGDINKRLVQTEILLN